LDKKAESVVSLV